MDLTKYRQCPAFTHGIHLSNDGATYKPCCWFTSGVDIQDYPQYQREIRAKDVAENCGYCIKMESADAASWSPRINWMNQTNKGTKRMFVIDAMMGNLCNLKCVTCSPANSSQIAAEIQTYSPHKFNSKLSNKLNTDVPARIEFLQQVILEKKDERITVGLMGGEPLINPDVIAFLRWLTEQVIVRDFNINITTNGTRVDLDLIETILKKGIFLNIQLSADGVGDTFELLRSNAKMKDLEKHSRIFYDLARKYKIFSMAYNYTLSWMNSLHFTEFLNWVQDHTPHTKVHVTKLVGPREFSVDCLPSRIRKKIYTQALSMYVDKNQSSMNSAIALYKQHMLSQKVLDFEPAVFGYGISRLTQLDSMRGTDHTKVLRPVLDLISSRLDGNERDMIATRSWPPSREDDKLWVPVNPLGRGV